MQNHSTRRPSPKYLIAQSLFLEVNANRDKRLETYKSRQHHDKAHANQLAQELEADLRFYCESQREVDRLLDVINTFMLRLLAMEMEVKLERGITQDFIKSKQLDEELISFISEQLKPKLRKPTAQIA